MAGDAASVAGDTANTSGRHRVACDVTFDLTSHLARVKLIYHTADVLVFYPRLVWSPKVGPHSSLVQYLLMPVEVGGGVVVPV